jgi:hypothetical protein
MIPLSLEATELSIGLDGTGVLEAGRTHRAAKVRSHDRTAGIGRLASTAAPDKLDGKCESRQISAGGHVGVRTRCTVGRKPGAALSHAHRLFGAPPLTAERATSFGGFMEMLLSPGARQQAKPPRQFRQNALRAVPVYSRATLRAGIGAES